MVSSLVGESLRPFTYPEPLLHKHSPSTSSRPELVSQEILPTPYLQLRARLSQSLLNHWSVALLLVLLRLVFAARHLDQDLTQGIDDLNIACREVQVAASTAVSMPHYLAQGTNLLVQHSITDAVAASSAVIRGLLTAVEAIVLFFIDAFKSTYLCLLELALTGTTEAVIDAVETISTSINATLAQLASEMKIGVTDANSAISSVTSAIQKAASLLGLKVTIPTVSIPQIAQLTQISIPSSFNSELETIKQSISLENVKNATDLVIEYPFEQLKVLVNESLSNFTFDLNLLSVPSTQQLSFCDGSDVSNSLGTLRSAAFFSYHILVVLLIVAIILSILPHAYLEWWTWRSLSMNASIAQKSIAAMGKDDPVDLVLIAAHPIQNLLGIKLASRFRSQKGKILARWFVSYVCHPPVLLLFFLGLCGLLACMLQIIMLNSLQRVAPSIAEEAGNVSSMVYESITNTSKLWADHTNSQVAVTQLQLNKDLFGWVESSTIAVNTTLNTFTDTLTSTLNSTFGGTILYDPILKVLDCILLLKVAGIETGLTWVHDQAHITLPQVPTSALAMTQSDANTMFSDVGATSAERIEGVKQSITKLWRASIRQEAIISGSLLSVWLLAVLIAVGRCLIDSGRTPTRTAFTSCFADDVKACISRPRAMEHAAPNFSIQEPRRLSRDSDNMSDTSTLRSVYLSESDKQDPHKDRAVFLSTKKLVVLQSTTHKSNAHLSVYPVLE